MGPSNCFVTHILQNIFFKYECLLKTILVTNYRQITSHSYPVKKDDSSGARACREILIVAVDKGDNMRNIVIHTALLTEITLIKTLILP